MGPHPAFDDRTIPETAEVGAFRLRMLGLADLDADMAAIEESGADLHGVMGDSWPEGLTREDDAIDLAWHQKEFVSRRSFAFIIADETSDYLGCVYVMPLLGVADRAEIWFWFRSAVRDRDLGPAFRTAFTAWLDGPVWPRLAYDWRS